MECLDLCVLGGFNTKDDTVIEAPEECLDLCGLNLGRRPARFDIENGMYYVSIKQEKNAGAEKRGLVNGPGNSRQIRS
eukprot:16409832-Heterocapsa_arctica.AAC.1